MDESIKKAIIRFAERELFLAEYRVYDKRDKAKILWQALCNSNVIFIENPDNAQAVKAIIRRKVKKA